METSTEEDDVVAQLRREIACLREQLALFENLGQGCTSGGLTSTGPLAHILYFNTPSSVCCRQKIDELISYVSSPANGEANPNYQPNAVQVKSLDDGFTLKVTGAVEYYTDFCVDRLGTPMLLIGDEISMDVSLSVFYSQVYTEPPWDSTAQASKEDARPRRISLRCFNCDGDHHLKDCTQPRDFAKISASRQTFKDSSTPGPDKRYHVGVASDYGKKFVPGKISDRLRQALGMTGDEYPPYIHRMRELGYPPGYRLLQMTESLVLYGGEVSGSSSTIAFQSKEVIYPGFNEQEIETIDMDLDEIEAQTVGISQKSGGDYDFEEGEILEDGSAVCQTRAKRQSQEEKTETAPEETRTVSHSGDLKSGGETETLTQPESVDEHSKAKRFSLDFPPGLVHDISECETSPKRWNALKRLLAEKKSRRKSKQFSFSLQ